MTAARRLVKLAVLAFAIVGAWFTATVYAAK